MTSSTVPCPNESTFRLGIATAICKIDPSQSEAFNVLLDGLKQRGDRRLRSTAIGSLRDLGPAATGAIPDLLAEALNDRDKLVRQSAADALKKIEGEKTP